MTDPLLLMHRYRYLDKGTKKWKATTWRMSKETAAEHFGDTQYEIIESSAETRRYLGQMTTSGFGAKLTD